MMDEMSDEVSDECRRSIAAVSAPQVCCTPAGALLHICRWSLAGHFVAIQWAKLGIIWSRLGGNWLEYGRKMVTHGIMGQLVALCGLKMVFLWPRKGHKMVSLWASSGLRMGLWWPDWAASVRLLILAANFTVAIFDRIC